MGEKGITREEKRGKMKNLEKWAEWWHELLNDTKRGIVLGITLLLHVLFWEVTWRKGNE